jgi:small subunit ribosomal protein S4
LVKRVGVNIFGNPKFDALLAKKSKKRMAKKPSEYALQLKEKQTARYLFNISEKQFRKYFDMAYKGEGVTGIELLRLLERRLDNVLFRVGIAETRAQARQMISHGHFEYNGNRVNVPSVLVKPGDVLTLRKSMQSSPLYVRFTGASAIKWASLDAKAKTLLVDRLPEDDELEQLVNVQLIVEFYSR